MKNREPYCRCHIDPDQVSRIMSKDPDGWIDVTPYVAGGVISLVMMVVMALVIGFAIFG